jgi:hypothetical protein
VKDLAEDPTRLTFVSLPRVLLVDSMNMTTRPFGFSGLAKQRRTNLLHSYCWGEWGTRKHTEGAPAVVELNVHPVMTVNR